MSRRSERLGALWLHFETKVTSGMVESHRQDVGYSIWQLTIITYKPFQSVKLKELNKQHFIVQHHKYKLIYSIRASYNVDVRVLYTTMV